MVAVAAVCLMAAFAAPTAGAAAGNQSKASASAAKAEKKAKKTKARIAVTKKRLHLKIRNNRRYIRGTRKLMRRLGGRLRDAISGGDKSIDDKINGIVAVVTPVLQQLGEGVIALRDGSLALKAGLEELAAKTIAGFDDVKAGFAEVEDGFGQVEEALTTIATSQEYGVTGLFLTFDPDGGGPSGDITVRGPLVGSADIPDDSNSVAALGSVPITISGSPSPPTSFPANTRVSLRSAIRSGEEGDGDASGDPAGQVGGLLYVKDASNATGASAGGTIICGVGPTATAYSYDPPGDGAPTTLPLKEIQEAADRTDQTRPNAGDVNPVSGGAATGPLADSSSGSCNLPAPGTYEVVVQTQYVDLPTSEDPDADD